MDKIDVFISHITEEKDTAISLKVRFVQTFVIQ